MPVRYFTLVFTTSHHAFWAEDLARDRQLPVEVVSAPATASDKCGLALRIASSHIDDLEAACREAGIDFQRAIA